MPTCIQHPRPQRFQRSSPTVVAGAASQAHTDPGRARLQRRGDELAHPAAGGAQGAAPGGWEPPQSMCLGRLEVGVRGRPGGAAQKTEACRDGSAERILHRHRSQLDRRHRHPEGIQGAGAAVTQGQAAGGTCGPGGEHALHDGGHLCRTQRSLHLEGRKQQSLGPRRRGRRCRWHVSPPASGGPSTAVRPRWTTRSARAQPVPVGRVHRDAPHSGGRISMRLPLLIDSDLALDDWMALVSLLQCPEVDVRAITVAATGEAHAGPGVKNTLRLMALTGVEGIPVASGRTTPLAGTHRFPLALRLAMDFRLGLGLPRPRTRPSGGSAVALLRRTLLEAPAPCTLLALGPLTNLAQLFEGAPELVPRVSHLWVMGGALDVPGNIQEINPRIDNLSAEWNLYIDPTAAERVLQSGVPVTLVPLDATSQVPLTDAFLAQLDAEGTSPASRFVSRVIHRIRPLLSR